ncbi:MAG: hypothetical protein FWD13_05370 [Treponema sp.]|nr:hypothetical protein [Treponema sp.]
MTVFEIFRKIAIETWYKLSLAKELDIALGEETITDINLLTIKSACHPMIKLKKFNKREEGKEGADWEWWITGKSNKWVGLRIQAKIINFKTNNYISLHYKKGEQYKNLISRSIENNAIPLYCLYTICDKSQITDKFHSNSCGLTYETYGCSFVDAFIVNKIKNKKHISDLIHDMFPWQCIFCNLEFDYDDLPNKVLSVFKRQTQLFAECYDITHETDKYIQNFYLSDAPPDYISRFMKNPNAEIIAPDNELAGIMIISEGVKAF